MRNQDLVKVGWVSDAHGLKGELYVGLLAKQADWLESLKTFWLQREDESGQEYRALKYRAHKKGLIILPEGIRDRTQAEKLIGASFLIPHSLIKSKPGEAMFLGEFLGFVVRGPGGEVLGKVVALGSNGPQDLLVLENSLGRFDVPLVDQFIIEINSEGQYLVMDLPEGLIESEK